MALYSASSVEALEYDFRGIKTADGKGYCSGKGEIPEPSQEDLEEFQRVMELYSPDKLAKMSKEEQKAADEHTMDAVVKLCKNSPSKDELMELPPRRQRGFFKVLLKELVDPEV